MLLATRFVLVKKESKLKKKKKKLETPAFT